jgi:DNA-binding transcriptional LysR family regulator
MNFTLEQLRVLEAIDRTGSFAAAARATHRVPSAVTYLIQELETSLGLALFDRSRRRAVLTAAGVRVLESARAVLNEAGALERMCIELAGGWEAELHVIVDAALPLVPLTACLSRFAESDVPTRLRVNVECQEGVLDHFERAHADIALYLGFDSNAEAAAFEQIALPPLEMILVAATSHPLAAQPECDPPASGYAELVVQDTAARFSAHARSSFLGSRNVVSLADFYSKRIALLAGAGYGWIPSHLVEADLVAGTLRELRAETSRWTYAPQVVTRRRAPLGKAGRLFVATLLQASETFT